MLTKINKILTNILKILFFISLSAVIVLLAASTVRGIKGNPEPKAIRNELQVEGQPFELSPERSRYAIIQSLVENNSLFFSKEIAEYVEPDLGYKNGKFVSLVAPGTAFMAYPFYVLGRSFDLAQVATFSLSAVVGIFNLFLITLIVKRLTGNWAAGMVAGLTFLFGTVAWVYSAILYHHHLTTFFLLISIYVLLRETKFYTSFLVALFAGLSFFIEYPNVIFFLPILIFTLVRHVKIEKVSEKYILKVKLALVGGVLGLAIALVPTYLFNLYSYGDPFQLAGTIPSATSLNINWNTGAVTKKVEATKPKTALGSFKSERLPNSLSVLLSSEDRGLLFFSPVILFGLFGIRPLYKKRQDVTYVLLGIITLVLLLYGMWGDPWGGWGFGPRYLVPAIGIMAIFLGAAVCEYGKKVLFFLAFLPVLIYSIAVNLAGVLTTIKLPPSVEVDYARYPRLIFLHNFVLVKAGTSGSFVYNTFLKGALTLYDYGQILLLVVLFLILLNYLLAVRKSREVGENV